MSIPGHCEGRHLIGFLCTHSGRGYRYYIPFGFGLA